MKNKRHLLILLITGLILLIPLVAMQFSDEVKWSIFDFAVAGVLLLSSGFILEFSLRKIKNKNYRIVVFGCLLILLLLLWVELAVGIFGSPIAGD